MTANARAATSLLVCGAMMVAGCIYIPAPDSPAERGAPDPNRLIGGVASAKPIRPGAVTRSEVLETIGPGPVKQFDENSITYLFEMKAGVWYVFPVIFVRADRNIAARLEFDANDVLQNTRIERGDPSPMNFLGGSASIPRLWDESTRSRRTSPTTRPATRGAVS